VKRILLLLAALLLLGCTSQEAHLIYLKEATPTPAPLHTPTPPPVPDPIVLAPIEGEGFTTDENGLPILDPRTHYYTYYLTVDSLRIYEENGETLIDAVITNNFDRPLSGGLSIVFKQDSLKYGDAAFYTADGGLKLFPGENRVYADVRTEVDVQMMDFELTVTTPFVPE
jgi:hypothetical protein